MLIKLPSIHCNLEWDTIYILKRDLIYFVGRISQRITAWSIFDLPWRKNKDLCLYFRREVWMSIVNITYLIPLGMIGHNFEFSKVVLKIGDALAFRLVKDWEQTNAGNSNNPRFNTYTLDWFHFFSLNYTTWNGL